MSKILVIAEHQDGKLNLATARAVSAAVAVKSDAIDVLVLSDAPDAIAAEAAKIGGVSRILTITRAENAHPLAAVLAPQIAKAAAGYSHVFVPSTTFGKDVAPRVAALLGVAQVSDVMTVESANTFKRPIYAGNAIITVEADAAHTVVATIRTASWPAAANGANSAPVEVLSIDATLPSHTRFVELRQGSSDRPDLQSARKVVSGGRGVGSKENFDIIYKFADKIGAAVGASRRRRRRLLPERNAGWPDRQDHRPRTVHGDRHFGRHPAPHRHQGRRHHRGDQQGWRSTDLRGRGFWTSWRSVQAFAGTGNCDPSDLTCPLTMSSLLTAYKTLRFGLPSKQLAHPPDRQNTALHTAP